jgi:hypothetical protein
MPDEKPGRPAAAAAGGLLPDQGKETALDFVAGGLDLIGQIQSTLRETIRVVEQSHAEERADFCAEIDRLRDVCGQAYQLAGAVGAPERVLDVLAAAAAGDTLPHDGVFLPVAAAECEDLPRPTRDPNGLVNDMFREARKQKEQ